MINVIHMNQIGVDGLRPVMYFEFGFSNSSDLPKNNVFQLGDKICVIGNGSIAVSNVDKTAFVFTNGQWVKSNNVGITNSNPNIITSSGSYDISNNDVEGFNKITVNGDSATLIEKSITANGIYTASDDNADGYSEVTVNVTSMGMPKLATPVAAANMFKNYYINIDTALSYINGDMGIYEQGVPNAYKKYCVYTRPVSTIVFSWQSITDHGFYEVVFVAGNNFSIKYYEFNDSTTTTKVSLGTTLTYGKVYRIKLHMDTAQGRNFVYKDSIEEYDEPIKFTVT